jgi:hypothetical protein
MEEHPPLPPAPSLGSSILNVFTAPSDAFMGLDKTESKASLWIVPLIITIAMVILVMVVGFTNENLKSQRLDATRTVLEKRVADGKMTQDQMEQTMDAMERGSGMMLAFQIIAVTVIFSIIFFLSALILWMGNKFILKSPAGYEKILELTGIASWIGAFGVLIQMLLMIGLNSIYAQPGLSLFIYSTFDPSNSLHKILAMINFFSIWQTVIVGIGLNKWSEKGMTMAMIVSFVIWLLTLALMYGLGFGG